MTNRTLATWPKISWRVAKRAFGIVISGMTQRNGVKFGLDRQLTWTELEYANVPLRHLTMRRIRALLRRDLEG